MSEISSEDPFSRLSRAIQDRKVILWAGAGLSSDAGYPTGKDLANLLLKRLGESQDTREKLPSVAERFVTATKGRDELEQVLKELFSEGRESRIHQQIAAINRFPYIITTNYDPLFEDAFGDDLLVIRNQSELSGTASAGEKTILYKIHGDARRPETIVITKSDYRRLDKNSLLWDVLRTRLAEYSILFIGYSLRDPNTLKHLKTVLERLGEHANPYYLIDLKTDGIVPKELADASIELIEMPADQAIGEIFDNLCEVALISARDSATLRRNQGLFRANDLKVTYREEDEQLRYVKVTAREKNKPMITHCTLRTKLPQDSEKGRQLFGLESGLHFEDVEIGEEYDPHLDIYANKVRLSELTKYKKVKLSRRPNKQVRVDLQIANDPTLRLGNVWLKIFHSETHFKVVFLDKWFTFGVFGPRISQAGVYTSQLILEFKFLVKDIERARAFFSILDAWHNGEIIDIIRHDGESTVQFPTPVSKTTDKVWNDVHRLKGLYTDLDDIQRHAKVRFKIGKEISVVDQRRSEETAAFIRGDKKPIENVSGHLTRINREAFSAVTKKVGALRISGDGWRETTILKTLVKIPIVVEGQDVEMADYEDVMGRFKAGANALDFKIQKGDGELFARYQPDEIDRPSPTTTFWEFDGARIHGL
jgi:hypothetical protein